MMHQKEWLVRVPALTKPFQADVGDRICHMNPIKRDQILPPRLLTANPKLRAVIAALTGQYAVVVKICGLILQMPFPDHGRLVASLLHLAGQHLTTHWHPAAEVKRAVDVAMLPGQHARA